MPDASIAAKETAFQFEVAAQGYPTPVVRLQRGPEAGIDGRALMIMDLVDGAPLLAGLDGVAAIVKLPSLARRLPVVLAEVLARLHRLDAGPIGSGNDWRPAVPLDPPSTACSTACVRQQSYLTGRLWRAAPSG